MLTSQGPCVAGRPLLRETPPPPSRGVDGWVRRQKKNSFEFGLKVPAPLIDFIFRGRKIFLM